jgi:hypothetical protein
MTRQTGEFVNENNHKEYWIASCFASLLSQFAMTDKQDAARHYVFAEKRLRAIRV